MAEDSAAIRFLYQRVAHESGGLARCAEEVTDDYVRGFLTRSVAQGVALVAERAETGQLVAEIHAYSSGLKVFAHVLGELTVAVDTTAQGQGLGRRLFLALLDEVKARFPQVRRVELMVRESNTRAIKLYKQLGFQQEGRFVGRVAGANGLENDLAMAWYAPLFAGTTPLS